MNFSLSKKKSVKEQDVPATRGETGGMNSFVAQFFVFDGDRYLGWDCFDSRKVRVGRSAASDLVLNDEALADIQAEFMIRGERISVSDKGGNGALTVNDQTVSDCILNPLDVLKIGRYTIKVKLKGMETPAVKSEKVSAAPKPAPERKVKTPVKKVPPTEEPALGLSDVQFEQDPDAVDLDELLGASAEKAWNTSGPQKQDELRLSDVFDEDTEMIGLEELFEDDDDESGQKTIQEVGEPGESQEPELEITWDELTDELPAQPTCVMTPAVDEKTDVTPAVETKAKTKPKAVKVAPSPKPAKTKGPEIRNTFPASFFKVIEDEEDQDEEDFPAAFSLREKLVGKERNAGRTPHGEKVLEVIRFRGDNVLDVTHLKEKGEHVLIDDDKQFCRVSYQGNKGSRLVFTEPLLGVINRSGETEFKADKRLSGKDLLSMRKTWSSMLPAKGELTLSDGFYDYVIRQSFVNEGPVIKEARTEDLPMHKRVTRSTAFKYTSRAVIFHFILMIILSYSITMPDKAEIKDAETYFVVVETENIHKPIKPKPKPKPVAPKAVPQKVVKQKPKDGVQVASLRPKKVKTKPKKAGAPEAGGGHKGNVVNRNVNEMGLLATLGMKTGIEIKPNDALASVTNMDAITSSHAKEAQLKVGGLVGDLGDGRIAIPTGGVINNKGAADVFRSAGIGGKGSVAALQNGDTGQREVSAVVSAPLTKKVKFKGGGISREAVAKVINDHIDEINYCYETALISDPTLMGKIEFEWTILLSGDVGEVKIKSSSVKSNEIHSCIKAAIRSWKFPKPKGAAVVVSYPFVFDVSGF